MTWKNIPPNKKANWDSLNEGQRRYAWEQYNLALVRRGLPFNHPFPGSQQNHPEENQPNFEDVLREGESAEEQLQEEVLNNFDENLLEESSTTHNQQHNNSMADSTVSHQQNQPGPPSKKRKGGPRTAADGAKKLPGSAMDQGSAGHEGGPRDEPLPHPASRIHSYVRHFSKMHKVLTYGISYNNINKTSGTPAVTINYISTPLCNIPWDWLFWYLNDSEFAILPNGSHINKCKITVVQRNVRVAFPVNATNNNLATLNQNKDIICAVGLNKKVDASVVKYTAFEAEQPMIPSDLELWATDDYHSLQEDMYGTRANLNSVVPRHQMGIPIQVPSYLALTYHRNDSSNNDGWECLQEHYKDIDADASSGSIILEQEYHPFMGLIKPPHKLVLRKLAAQQWRLARGSHQLQPHTTNITVGTGNNITNVTDATTAVSTNLQNMTDTFQLIEKSQHIYEGLFNRGHVKVQDSIHIGVQPTVALTTANLINDQSNSSFTDTQAYFEIYSEIEVNTSFPTFRPLTNVTNIKEGQFWERENQTTYDYNRPLLDGLRVF